MADFPRTEDEYLNTRVQDQISWYDKKSVFNKKWFFGLKIGEIILALFVPFLSGYADNADMRIKLVIGIVGIIVAAIAGLITLVKFQENWIVYRTVTESLKLEKFLFLSGAGPYKKNTDAFPLFVERFEHVIAASTQQWVNYIAKQEVSSQEQS